MNFCSKVCRWCRHGGRSPWRGASHWPRSAVNLAATMASRIACSWNRGTPRVFFSTVVQFIRRPCSGLGGEGKTFPDLRKIGAALQIGMHHAALDGAGPHDRHFHHQIIECRAAAGAAACSSGRGFPPGTRRWRRPCTACRKSAGSFCGTVARVSFSSLPLPAWPVDQIKGFIGRLAGNLDIGNLVKDPLIRNPVEYRRRIRDYLLEFRHWLLKGYPELVATYDARLEAL